MSKINLRVINGGLEDKSLTVEEAAREYRKELEGEAVTAETYGL